MKIQKLIAVLALALCSLSANATVFNWSYTFGANDSSAVVSGSLTGTLAGDYIRARSL